MGQSLTISADLPDEAATNDYSRRLVAALPSAPHGWLILLEGELGAGKSTLARAMLREYGHEGAVPSPTYTLVEPYHLPEFTLYHIDLYRISSTDELEFLGWSDLDEGLRLVEWPERVAGIEAQADIRVVMRYAGDGRAAELHGLSQRGLEVLAGMDLK